MTASVILRLHEVSRAVGLGRTSIYRRIAAGTFPRPVQLGPSARAVGWRESDVIEWIESLATKPSQAA
jgi:prophage regulatory protein